MKIYNTLTRHKEEFRPIEEGKLRMYVCGPTVYNYIHIGNLRPLVVFDTFRRYMLEKGYDVRYVVNFTDVDDKIINQAKKENIAIDEVTAFYIKAFMEDAKRINLLEEKTIHPHATDYVPKMVEFVKELVDKGAAYEVDGDVFFDITRAKDYGKLSKKNIDELRSGARISVDEKKKNPLDFALWKAQKDAFEPAWESPWGMGRPGWHIECSVMAQNLLGKTIDIHAGGADLEFPHHENEIAQSEAHNDCTFANYWMHNGMITVDKEKMSKSKGNFFLAKDIAQEYSMEVVRLWLLSVHYRNPIDFSEAVLKQNETALERLHTAREHALNLAKTAKDGEASDFVQETEKARADFDARMEDDLNTADALSVVYDYVRLANSRLDEHSVKADVEAAVAFYEMVARVLGLFYREEDAITDEEILALIEERTQARAEKNFARADEIRDELAARGIELKDTRQGVTFSRTRS